MSWKLSTWSKERSIEAEWSTTNEKEKAIEDKEKENLDSVWEEKDVLLRTWIPGTMIEERMYLIVGCSTTKEM